MSLPTKVCLTCGRTFTWRKKWERDWEQVKACSRACRGGPSPLDRRCEAALLELLGERRADSSCCPSEVARRVAPADWRPLMERVRQAGRRLAREGRVEITQGGRVVSPDRFRGPIRLRRGSEF